MPRIVVLRRRCRIDRRRRCTPVIGDTTCYFWDSEKEKCKLIVKRKRPHIYRSRVTGQTYMPLPSSVKEAKRLVLI